MDSKIIRLGRAVINQAPVWVLFILGMWLVIIRPLGAQLALVPGDLGDARLNNYVLEQFFHWVSGLTRDYWNATFFFPFQWTMAFSDNLLGSAPFYALFRWANLDQMSAFQGWYMLGCCLNYAAAGFVLGRLKLKPLAVGAGAFFFTFGLPLLAQENHAQLLYHFCIPLACFSLWKFYQAPGLKWLAALAFWTVWQFYLTIYMGVFLLLLLAALFVLLPFWVPSLTFRQRLTAWPQRLIKSWTQANRTGRILAITTMVVMGLGLVGLLWPYFHVYRLYHFSRGWAEVSRMLPRPQSYILADNSQVWKTGSFPANVGLRHEHQLFPGLAVLLLVLAGIAGRFKTENRRLAWLHLGAALVLVLLTLDVDGFSLYQWIWRIPGLNSIRAITRIMLVMMWPLSVFIAWAVDGFIQRFSQQRRWMQAAVYLVVGLLVVESVFYNHTTYAKADSQARLDSLRQLIPASVPANPILFAFISPQRTDPAKEIDVMLLAQELGWATMNGYSGNFPPDYVSPHSCKDLPGLIQNYTDNTHYPGPTFALELTKRVVPLGFVDCDPNGWGKLP